MRKIFLVFFASLIVSGSFAQTSDKDLKEEHKERRDGLQREDEEGVIDYKKHFAAGFKLISDGYGFFLELGRAKSIQKSWLFQFEFSELKSPKEVKQTLPYPPGTAFIYGKANFFYPVKFGVQQQLLLANKSNKNGVCITANYGGGFILGLLRPYLYNVFDQSDTTYKYTTYQNATSSDILLGGPDIGKGWNGLSVIPGLYAKGAFRFDYGHNNHVLSAVEIGISASIYTRKVPIMVFTEPRQYDVSVYAAIMFGGRQ